jgi:adenylate kinase
MAAGSELGREADRFTRKGQLFPDRIALQLVEKWLEDRVDAFVFDGFPRSIPQADGLAELLSTRDFPVEVALSLEASEETIRRRVLNRRVCESCKRTVSVGLHVESETSTCPSCGGGLARRSDDTLGALARRMDEYREKTEPLIGYYEERGVLEPVGSEETPEIVFERVSQILEAV